MGYLLWERPSSKTEKGRVTCPGNDADPGVEPPEWLGELGRDLQACSAACFFWATIFWAAEKQTLKQLSLFQMSVCK